MIATAAAAPRRRERLTRSAGEVLASDDNRTRLTLALVNKISILIDTDA